MYTCNIVEALIVVQWDTITPYTVPPPEVSTWKTTLIRISPLTRIHFRFQFFLVSAWIFIFLVRSPCDFWRKIYTTSKILWFLYEDNWRMSRSSILNFTTSYRYFSLLHSYYWGNFKEGYVMKIAVLGQFCAKVIAHRDGGAGGGLRTPPLPPLFWRKNVLVKYKVDAVNTRSTCQFTPYPGWVFFREILEKYVIENVENTNSEPLDRPPPPPNKLASPARVFKRNPSLLPPGWNCAAPSLIQCFHKVLLESYEKDVQQFSTGITNHNNHDGWFLQT